MASNRALLDMLMGSDRNDSQDVRQVKRQAVRWQSSRHCRTHLATGECCHQLFGGTKAAIGECRLEHDNLARQAFNDESKDTQRPVLQEALHAVSRVYNDAQDRIKHATQRLAPHLRLTVNEATGAATDITTPADLERVLQAAAAAQALGDAALAPPQLTPEQLADDSAKAELDSLVMQTRAEMTELQASLEQNRTDLAAATKQAQQTEKPPASTTNGAASPKSSLKSSPESAPEQQVDSLQQKIAEQETKLREASQKLDTQLKLALESASQRRRDAQLSQHQAALAGAKSDRVCTVCGSLLVVGDTMDRLRSHNEGKQHLGFATVQRLYAELKEQLHGKDWNKRDSNSTNNSNNTHSNPAKPLNGLTDSAAATTNGTAASKLVGTLQVTPPVAGAAPAHRLKCRGMWGTATAAMRGEPESREASPRRIEPPVVKPVLPVFEAHFSSPVKTLSQLLPSATVPAAPITSSADRARTTLASPVDARKAPATSNTSMTTAKAASSAVEPVIERYVPPAMRSSSRARNGGAAPPPRRSLSRDRERARERDRDPRDRSRGQSRRGQSRSRSRSRRRDEPRDDRLESRGGRRLSDERRGGLGAERISDRIRLPRDEPRDVRRRSREREPDRERDRSRERERERDRERDRSGRPRDRGPIEVSATRRDVPLEHRRRERERDEIMRAAVSGPIPLERRRGDSRRRDLDASDRVSDRERASERPRRRSRSRSRSPQRDPAADRLRESERYPRVRASDRERERDRDRERGTERDRDRERERDRPTATASSSGSTRDRERDRERERVSDRDRDRDRDLPRRDRERDRR